MKKSMQCAQLVKIVKSTLNYLQINILEDTDRVDVKFSSCWSIDLSDKKFIFLGVQVTNEISSVSSVSRESSMEM